MRFWEPCVCRRPEIRPATDSDKNEIIGNRSESMFFGDESAATGVVDTKEITTALTESFTQYTIMVNPFVVVRRKD